jgi:hypothetical protein
MRSTENEGVGELASCLLLGALIERVSERWGSFALLDHWQQGEFHHDLVLRIAIPHAGLPGPVLVVATNCNGGIKEVLCFADVPQRGALWHFRCPSNAEFAGTLPPVLAASVTEHWFDPCELLTPDTRSEYRAEFRERQGGGGWIPRKVTA